MSPANFNIESMVNAVMAGYREALSKRARPACRRRCDRQIPDVRSPMALFSADQLRSIDPGEAPRQGASRPHAALLDKLTAEAARPAYSRVVVVGAVRGIEFGMLLLTGLALFHLHVVRRRLPSGRSTISRALGISMLAILVFQTLQSYTVADVPASGPAVVPHGRRLVRDFFHRVRRDVFPEGRRRDVRVWIASWLLWDSSNWRPSACFWRKSWARWPEPGVSSDAR